MTQLVVDAEVRGEQPPTRISPKHLPHRPQPTLAELRAAYSFHRLSRAMAKTFAEHAHWYPSDRAAPEEPRHYPEWIARMTGNFSRARWYPSDVDRPAPEEPARYPEWIARVDQAVFRVLILGAALAGAYQEPLFKAREHPDPEVKALLRRLPRDDDSLAQTQGNYDLGDKELAFLMQFAICDLEATLEAQDAVFGPIAEWLLESILSDREAREAMAKRFDLGYGRAGFCLEHTDPDDPCPVGLADGSHSDAHLVVWELMKMLWVAEHVRPGGMYHDPDPDPEPDRARDGALGRAPPDPQTAEDLSVDEKIHYGPLQSAVAIFFGKFRAERVMLPKGPLSPREGLTARPVVPRTKKENPSGMSVFLFLDWIFYHSGRPNQVEDTFDAVAPLELKFFEYVLQRHLGVCFAATTFRREYEKEYLYQSYEEFTEGITIFSHDDVGDREASYWSDLLEVGDFLDGSEILTKYPPEFNREYNPSRGWQ
jgi:hypothetical protein